MWLSLHRQYSLLTFQERLGKLGLNIADYLEQDKREDLTTLQTLFALFSLSLYENKPALYLFPCVLWAFIPGVLLKDSLESRVFSFNSHCVHWTSEKSFIFNTGSWMLEYIGILPSRAPLFCPFAHVFTWLCYSTFSLLPHLYKIHLFN